MTIPDSDLAPVAAVIVLAAGGGTRMKSRRSKLLHELCGKSMLSYAVSAASALNPQHLVVVVGHQRVEVLEHLESLSQNVTTAVQEQQLGTGHAVTCGLRQLPDLEGEVVVTYGDVPLLTGKTLRKLVSIHRAESNAVTVLTAEVEDPTGYGRIVRTGGKVTGIVEHRDASDEQLLIREINSGIYVFDAAILRDGLTHLSTDNAFNIRAVALFSALWCLIFCTPLLIRMRRRERVLPEVLPTGELRFLERGLARLSPARQGGLFAAYKELWRTIMRLRTTAPQTLYFLCASAIFRDGLAGIFTFGGVLAAGSFGFSTSDVIIFGVAANGVAAVGAVLGGYLDDYLGPKKIIIFSLVAILIAAVPLLLFPYPMTFWICALILALFVGPAQSSSRTFLARIADPGTEGELFGLYSTTGRATSFLAPMLFGLFVTIFNAQVWGIVGIMIVVLAGLLMTLPLESPQALHLRKARRAEKKAAKAAQR